MAKVDRIIKRSGNIVMGNKCSNALVVRLIWESHVEAKVVNVESERQWKIKKPKSLQG